MMKRCWFLWKTQQNGLAVMGDLPNQRYRDVKRHNDGLIVMGNLPKWKYEDKGCENVKVSLIVMGDLPMGNQINIDEDFLL